MQIRILRTQNGRMGLLRAGVIITAEDRFAKQLIRLGTAEEVEPRVNEPDRNTDLGGPDKTKKEDDQGNGEGGGSSEDDAPPPVVQTSSRRGQASGEKASSSEEPPAGGKAAPLLSPPRGRASRKKTLNLSGARRN